MTTTSLSLLDRLKGAGPGHPDWLRLQEIYLPLVRVWIGRVPGLAGESDDLAQEVLAVLAREIPRFERRREGSFRAWLRQVTVNKVRTYRKRGRHRSATGLDGADGFLDRLEAPGGEMAREWDLDHDRHVFGKLLAMIRPDFSETTWDAFRRFAVEGLPSAAVAADLGLTENAVIRAKSRILKRLREEAGELLG